MKNKIKQLFNRFISFVKKWGVFGILAIISLYTPLWLGFILNDSDMISFGWKWAAVWALPFPPAWLAIVVLAAFYKWVWRFVIVAAYNNIREAIKKVQRQNQFGLYYTSEEMDMMLDLGKEIKNFSDKERSKFKEKLRKDRLHKIDEQWTKHSEGDITNEEIS